MYAKRNTFSGIKINPSFKAHDLQKVVYLDRRQLAARYDLPQKIDLDHYRRNTVTKSARLPYPVFYWGLALLCTLVGGVGLL